MLGHSVYDRGGAVQNYRRQGRVRVQAYILPLILCAFGCVCLFSKNDVQTPFLEGAREGLGGAFSLIPTLVMIMTAVSLFNASGASEIITSLISPILNAVKIPPELAPLLIVRPLSGSGSTAILSDIFEKHGADSTVGLSASVICASSDTVFYVVSLYMSAINVKRTRHALPVALAVSVIGAILSCVLVRVLL
jgi:spore maturation protein B